MDHEEGKRPPSRQRGNNPVVIAACVLIPAALILLATLALRIPPRQILGDAATFVEQPIYLGLFSNLGVLGWWTAAIACLLARSLCADPVDRKILLWGGSLSLLLGLDDLLLLHESFGLDALFIAIYAAAAFGYVWRYLPVHRAAGLGLLATAILFLGASVGIDVVRDLYYSYLTGTAEWVSRTLFDVDMATASAQRVRSVEDFRTAAPPAGKIGLDDLRRIAEDGTKLIGITAWAAYHWCLARSLVRKERWVPSAA